MKKQLTTVSIFVILLFALSGCGLSFGFETETQPREPLDISAWPTPATPTPTVSPTPFPRATLPPTAAPTTSPTPEPEVPAAVESGTGSAEIISGDTTQLMQAAQALGLNLEPVAVFKVSADELAIRQGPGENYGQNAVVEKGELGAAMGQDSSGQWLYALTITGLRGWVPVDALRILGSVAEAPVLPADPIAAVQAQLAAQLGGSSSAVSPDSPVESAASAPLALDELTPVATGRVSANLVNMRQRPGPSYAQLDALPADSEVAIYGLNRDREWALVETAQGASGWVSMDYLDVTGSLNNAPQYRTLEPVAQNQAAPFVPLDAPVAQTQAVAAVETSDSSSQVAPAAAVINENNNVPAGIPTNTLSPVATANVDEKVDMRIGPAESYGALSTATVDETVAIRAVNPERSWAIIQRPNGKIGWVPLSSISVTNGFLENAQAVTTGLVTSNNLPLTGGPGIYYDDVGLVNRNDLVSVLAINPGRSWVLVEPAGGGRGWLQLRLIDNISEPLSSLPTIEAEPVAQAESAGPALPAPSGPPTGLLALQESSGGDILAINADGTDLRKISNGIDPVLSPDGSQVAFTRWQGDIGTLWVANVDGSGERAVLGEMRKAKGPDWSPDGEQIVLNFQQGGQVQDRDVCQSADRNIPFGRAANIQFKIGDDGEPIVCFVLLADPHWSLRIIDVASGDFEDQYGGQYAFRPAWDPAREWRIVSDAGNGLLAVDPNNDDYRQQLTEIIGDGSPVFSPDGRFIAVSTESNGIHDIFRLNADGGGRVKLTKTPLWEGIQPDQEATQWNNVAPAWSPDGSRIAFLTDRTGRWEIWVMNADGSEQQPLFSDGINEQLDIEYNFVDERVLSWR